MLLFDAHNHLDDPAYDVDRADVVQRARSQGVAGWVLAGTEPATWDRTTAVAHQTQGLAVLGIHPWYVHGLDDPSTAVAELATRELDGIGELGLDRNRASSEQARARQRHLFRAQLAVARERNLPVVLHCVGAYAQVLQILADDGLPEAGGMIHGFSASVETMQRAVRLGLLVSFGPLFLRDRARKARASATAVPEHHVVVESDGPDQAPAKDARGEPADARTVLAALAALRGTDEASLGRQTTENLRRLFPNL